MAVIREANENDKEEWNGVALESENATYAHTWEWKEVLEGGLGIKSLCIVAEEKGEIVGIYPGFLHSVSKTLLLKHFQILYSPLDLTWDYGGPCILPNIKKGVLEELVTTMEKLTKKEKAISIRVSPFEGDTLKNILISRDYRISRRDTSIIDLTKSEEELWKRIKKNARRYIKKPKREGVEVIDANDETGLREFFNCMRDLKKQHPKMYLPPNLIFEMILKIMVPRKMAKFHVLEYKNDVVGAGLSFYFKDVVTFRYGGAYVRYKNLHPHYLLHWSRIIESKELGYGRIDLGGMPSDKNNGIYFFKSRWGGKIKNVDWYVKDIRFRRIRELKRSILLTSRR